MQFVGHYEVLSELGDGGMGSVKLGRAPNGRIVVLKEPHAGDDSLKELLLDEARLGLRLKHPNIVETLDFFELEGQPVLVVAYVSGASLQDLRAFGPLPLAVVVRVARQICEALDALHHAKDENGKALNILHRDVTPANIMLGHDGNARLIDLGIAKHDDRRAQKTKTGYLRGTLRYMAPEIFDRGVYSPASDLWALGVSILDAALGRHAIPGLEGEVVARIVAGRVLDLRPGEKLDRRFERAIKKLLHGNLKKRPARGSEAAAIFAMLEKDLDGDAAAASAAVVAAIGEEQPLETEMSAESTELVASRATAMYRGLEVNDGLPPTRHDSPPPPPDADDLTIDEDDLEAPFAKSQPVLLPSDKTEALDENRLASQVASLGVHPDELKEQLDAELKGYLSQQTGEREAPPVTDAISSYANALRDLESSADGPAAEDEDESESESESNDDDDAEERSITEERPRPLRGGKLATGAASSTRDLSADHYQSTRAEVRGLGGVVFWAKSAPRTAAVAATAVLSLLALLLFFSSRSAEKVAGAAEKDAVQVVAPVPVVEPEVIPPAKAVRKREKVSKRSRPKRRRKRSRRAKAIVHSDPTLDSLRAKMPKCWAPGRTRMFFYQDRSGSAVAARRYSEVPKYARKTVRCVD